MESSSRFSSLSVYVQLVLKLVPTIPTVLTKKPSRFSRSSVLELVHRVHVVVDKKSSHFSRYSVLELVPTHLGPNFWRAAVVPLESRRSGNDETRGSFGESKSHKIKINSNRTSEAQRSIAATNNQPCGPSTTRPHTQPGLDLPLSSLRLLTFLECALPAPFLCFLVGPPALRPACPPARSRPCLPW